MLASQYITVQHMGSCSTWMCSHVEVPSYYRNTQTVNGNTYSHILPQSSQPNLRTAFIVAPCITESIYCSLTNKCTFIKLGEV